MCSPYVLLILEENSLCAALRNLHKADYLFFGMYSDLVLLSRRVCVCISLCFFFVVYVVVYHVSLGGLALLIFQSTPSLRGIAGSFVMEEKTTPPKNWRRINRHKARRTTYPEQHILTAGHALVRAPFPYASLKWMGMALTARWLQMAYLSLDWKMKLGY